MKILKVESTLPDGSKVVFDRESSKKEWDKIYRKFEKTRKFKTPSSFEDFISSLSSVDTILDEMLTFIRKDKFLKELVSSALIAILLKTIQNPSAMNDWLNQEQRNWADPAILQERLKNIENLNMGQKGDRT